VTAAKVTLVGALGNRLAGDRRGPWPSPDHALLLHGGGQTRHAWGGAARALAASGVTALTLDQRGHGDSEWPDAGGYRFEDYAEDLGAVVRAVQAEAGTPPVVIGASLGGLAAMLAIGEAGVPARALVLVDVTPRMDREGVTKVLGFMAERAAEGFASLEEAADAIAAYLPHRPRPRSLDGLRKNLRHDPDGRWRWHWDPRFVANRPTPSEREVLEARMVAAARKLTLPTLLVRGASSELVGEAEAREFRDIVPHAVHVDVSGARHMVAGDRNDAFTAAVVAFVGALGPSSRVA
jgi:pimeloyl-ACP methyl ester carboxylesterase